MKKVGLLGVCLVIALFSLVSFVSAACSECGGYCNPPTCTGYTGVYCTAEQCYSKGDCSYAGGIQTNFQWSLCTDIYEGNQGDIIPISECTTLNVSNARYILVNDLSSSGTCLTVNANNITIYGGEYVYTCTAWCGWWFARMQRTLVNQFVDAPVAIDASGRIYAENGKNIVVKDLTSSGDIVASASQGIGDDIRAAGSGGNIKLINSEFKSIISNGANFAINRGLGGSGGNIEIINSKVSSITSNGGYNHPYFSGRIIAGAANGGNIIIRNSNLSSINSITANSGGFTYTATSGNGGNVWIENSSFRLAENLFSFSLNKGGSGADGAVHFSNLLLNNDFGSVLFENIPGFYCGGYSLSNLISISNSSVTVNTDLCPGLNQPATISLYGLSLPHGAKITRNGESAEGSYTILSYENPFKFWVSHF